MRGATAKILVVDDDRQVRSALRDLLTDAGHVVIEAADGTTALEIAQSEHPDLVVLDLGLPDIGGLDVLRSITGADPIPVIVLSGRAGETDRVVGLDLGADDYIVKPFAPRELLARVNANLRSVRRRAVSAELDFGDLVVDLVTREVLVAGVPVVLTAKEFDLLAFLVASPKRVFSRDQLLRHVWGSSSDWQDTNTVGEHIYRVRRKLDAANRTRWIQAVRGVGYRFVPDV